MAHSRSLVPTSTRPAGAPTGGRPWAQVVIATLFVISALVEAYFFYDQIIK